MKNLNVDIKNKIIEFLKTKQYGASASEISKVVGHNRITVSKYLEIMKAHHLLDYEEVASAKVWHLSKKRDKPTVLIVDDEPHVVDLVAISLMSSQYNIIKAYSGFDALDKVYSETPDLIILDLMMPNINGFEVCQKLKENALTQHIPVIILSAKGELTDKLKGMKIGADDYITKPFDPMELEARVSMVLRRTSKNIDVHPLTHLPGISTARQMLASKLKEKGISYIINIKIRNAKKDKDNSIKKMNELIVLFSRLLSEILKTAGQSAFVCHTVKDDFIIFAEKEEIMIKIKDSFNNLLSFFSNGRNGREKISLKVKKIRLDEAEKKGMNEDRILDALEVS
jgi:DNA-binding response OmpR family regulator